MLDRMAPVTPEQGCKLTPIETSFAELKVSFETLQDRVSKLLNKISPVLKNCSQNQVDCCDKEKEPPKSPLRSEVEIVTKQIIDLRILIEDALDSIEL